MTASPRRAATRKAIEEALNNYLHSGDPDRQVEPGVMTGWVVLIAAETYENGEPVTLYVNEDAQDQPFHVTLGLLAYGYHGKTAQIRDYPRIVG